MLLWYVILYNRKESENMDKCPKCGGEMEVKSGKWDHNITVKAGLFGMKRPEMHVCKQCGYIEFYLK